MSVNNLNRLIVLAATFGPSYAQRLARRNRMLASLYKSTPGSHWQRLGVMADAVVSIRTTWRRYQHSALPPLPMTELERGMLDAARLVGKLPPSTSRGIAAALKNANIQISTEHSLADV